MRMLRNTVSLKFGARISSNKTLNDKKRSSYIKYGHAFILVFHAEVIRLYFIEVQGVSNILFLEISLRPLRIAKFINNCLLLLNLFQVSNRI